MLLVLAEVTRTEALSKQVDDLRRYIENIIQNMNSALVVVDLEGARRLREPDGGADPRRAARGAAAARACGAGSKARCASASSSARCARACASAASRAWSRATRRERVPIGISCAPLVDADGMRRGAVVIFPDLTEIKQLQRQVLQTEKMASIGQLAAGVAHEINNPMGFVHANLFQLGEYVADLARVFDGGAGAAQGLRDGPLAEVKRAAERVEAVAEELDADYLLEDCAKAVRESQEGSERIRHIVQDLRAFSHRDDSERSDADVNECLDSTANIVWTMMKHAVVLTKEYEDLPPVRCYPMQLKQVFMNLLVNAYQAIEEARPRTRPARARSACARARCRGAS